MTLKSTRYIIFGSLVICSWFFLVNANPVVKMNTLSESFGSLSSKTDYSATGNMRSKRQLDFLSEICPSIGKFLNHICAQLRKWIFQLIGGIFLGGGNNANGKSNVTVHLPTDSPTFNEIPTDDSSSSSNEPSFDLNSRLGGNSNQSSTSESTSSSSEQSTLTSEASSEISSESSPESSSQSIPETSSEASSEAPSTLETSSVSETSSTPAASSSSDKNSESTTTK